MPKKKTGKRGRLRKGGEKEGRKGENEGGGREGGQAPGSHVFTCRKNLSQHEKRQMPDSGEDVTL